MMSRFWWENKENDSKMACMSWERMGQLKNKGGLGFRNLETFNLAFSAKQGWRLHQNLDSLVAKIYKEKYYSQGNFLESSLGRSPSYAWRSIWSAKKLPKEGLVWRVGDGRSIKWVESPITYAIQSPVRILDRNATVNVKNFVKVYSKLINYKFIDVVYIVLKLNPKPKTIWKKIESFYIKEREIFCLLSKAANG